MTVVRPPAAAGTFYPAGADELRDLVEHLLARADPPAIDVEPAMLIVPHAGYAYSGPVAATAYKLLGALTPPPRRIVALGPSHFVRFAGIAGPEADALQTPLGTVAVDATAVPGAVIATAAAHATEHSLEVQLPFLQRTLAAFTVLPLLTGDVDQEEAAGVLEEALGPPGTFAIISSDLSHYLDDRTARERDERTARAITDLRPEDIGRDDACGSSAVKAALLVARQRGWICRRLDLRNSADTMGDRSRVVGYGAFALGPERG